MLLVALDAHAVEAPDPPAAVPLSGTKVTVSAKARPLGKVLEELSTHSGVTLRCGDPELARQRVTVFVRDVELREFCEGLRELLSIPNEAPVLWTNRRFEGRDSLTLVQSHRRRVWAEAQRLAELEPHRQLLEHEAEMARRLGRSELAAAESDIQRKTKLQDFVRRNLLEQIGPDGRQRLLMQEPVLRTVGELVDGGLPEVVEWLQSAAGQGHLSSGELQSYIVGLVHLENPTNARRSGVSLFLRPPGGGQVFSTGPIVSLPGIIDFRFENVSFIRPPTSEGRDNSVLSFSLADPDNAPTSENVALSFDDLLEKLAEATGLPIYSDGYLRKPAVVRPGARVQNYPLEAFLEHIAMRWQISWRRRSGVAEGYLLRSNAWWQEDAADVDNEALAELTRRRERSGGTLTLEDLAYVAATQAPRRAHRLAETERFPELKLLGEPDITAGGLPAFLRFYHHLSEAQKRAARSEQGLQLAQVSPGLLEQELLRALIVFGGATPVPESWRDMIVMADEIPPTAKQPGKMLLAIYTPGSQPFRGMIYWFKTGPGVRPEFGGWGIRSPDGIFRLNVDAE
jgi:hypothetical protein